MVYAGFGHLAKDCGILALRSTCAAEYGSAFPIVCKRAYMIAPEL